MNDARASRISKGRREKEEVGAGRSGAWRVSALTDKMAQFEVLAFRYRICAMRAITPSK
jgi:hypothetical protein